MKVRLLIFLVFSQYGLASRYGIGIWNINIQLEAEFDFLISGVTIANQARR